MYFYKKINITLVILLVIFAVLAGQALAEVATVQPGDTLYSISRYTQVPMDLIRKNSSLYFNSLTSGQILLIPEKYTVKSGDTLYLISQRLGVKLHEIIEFNNLNTDYIQPGQTLYIPQKSPYLQITVNRGDTLYEISKNYGVSIDDLRTTNGLWGKELYAGMKLFIPSNTKTENSDQLPSRGSIDRSSYINYGNGVYYTKEERVLLARLIEAEAEGEPYMGKVAVGAVVVNRVLSDKFPNTIKEVIYQVDETGRYQFEPYLNGRIFSVSVSSDSYKAADEALGGLDPTGGSLFFFNPYKISNTWLLSKPVICQIGNHVFTK